MSEQIYYKVENKDSELFRKASEFLEMEDRLREIQKKAIEAKVPKFSQYQGEFGFNRIVTYTVFVFDDIDNIDNKVWKTKMVDGRMLSTPNLRTKAGREMNEFLNSFTRTTVWNVNMLLGIGYEGVIAKYYPANLFKHKGCIYIILYSQLRDVFEKNNTDFIEITHKEINKVITDNITDYIK